MWLLTLLGISLVGGVILGVGWRLSEEAWDKYQSKKIQEEGPKPE
jgi:hypothetical protein